MKNDEVCGQKQVDSSAVATLLRELQELVFD